MDTFMAAVTHLGDAAIMFIALGIVLMISPKYRKYGIAIILSSILCQLIGNLGIKPLVGRLRPFDVDPSIILSIIPPTGYSFPSGHAMSSIAGATIICRTNIKPILKAIPIIMALLISFSRVYLYIHYPSDVIVGALLGVVIGLFSLWAVQKIMDRVSNRPSAPDPQ